MKVHPLFHPASEPTADDMLLMLDLPDDAPQKRAFLDQCSQSERLLSQWRELNALMAAGKALPQREPMPIHTKELDAAATIT